MTCTIIEFETNKGVMKAKLFDDQAPKTVENFKNLIRQGFYDGTRFHRVIAQFMIQGGDPLSKSTSLRTRWGTGGPGYTIDDEFAVGLKHGKKGILSMANSGPDTGGSQFFITLIATPWLDKRHAIFGELIGGEAVLDTIGKVDTDERDSPLRDVVLEKVRIVGSE